ncbi:hypothetical protein [Sorangium sp. So ce1024]|uniref:hypothetical protein n=1 Tax=unclassified Sorangium TaxID=2621164 RepID=UPI003F0E8088
MTLRMPSKNPAAFHQAPEASPPAARKLPGHGELPRVDERLVEAETREEMVGGRRVLAAPANPPHGDAHCQVDGEALFHVRPGYVASTDMLTRTDDGSDFATDTSIRKEGNDPATGARYLEEVVFEVVHRQPLRDLIERAERLTARGIRRMFAIFVDRRLVAEWSPADRAFRPLPIDAEIEDACLIRPLPVRALLDRAEGRNAVARVLLDEKNPVLTEAQQEAFRSGLAEGHRKAIERLCQALQIELTDARRAALARLDAAALEELAARIAAERRWPS